MSDNVNHPSHYTDGSIEVIDYIEDKKLGYHLGNAVKYISRAGKKDPEKYVEDLQKADWYIQRAIEKQAPVEEESKDVVTEDRRRLWIERRGCLQVCLEDGDFREGDEFDITLTDGTEVTLQYATDQKGDKFLVLKDLPWKEQMHHECMDDPIWRDTDLRMKCNQEYLELFPDWLREHIKPRENVQVYDSERIVTHDYTWPLSLTQIYGRDYLEKWLGKDCWWCKQDEGDSKLSVFKTFDDSVKLFEGFASIWWLRSGGSNSSFGGVYSDGSNYNSYANSSRGVCLGFWLVL